jgi:hypothetical protein
MYAYDVARHGIPNINGCPSSLLLGLINRKSTGYSQESTEISTSCNVTTGLTTDLSANCNIIEVGSKEVISRMLQVSMVRILMVTPKSTSVFGKEQPCILTITMGFPRSAYLTNSFFHRIILDKYPTT